jgi:hypothetical protein
MNWLEIDRIILNYMSLHSDRDKLYTDVKKKFNWDQNQVEAAVDPMLTRYDWFSKKVEKENTPKKRSVRANKKKSK